CTSACPLATALLSGSAAWAQQVPAPPPARPSTATPANASPGTVDEEKVITLTPFEVSARPDTGYGAATTLAGNRLNTELRDLGNSISVITAQFMKDIGATNNET